MVMYLWRYTSCFFSLFRLYVCTGSNFNCFLVSFCTFTYRIDIVCIRVRERDLLCNAEIWCVSLMPVEAQCKSWLYSVSDFYFWCCEHMIIKLSVQCNMPLRKMCPCLLQLHLVSVQEGHCDRRSWISHVFCDVSVCIFFVPSQCFLIQVFTIERILVSSQIR